MIDARPFGYGQYSILPRIWPAPANRYQSSFTIHKIEPGSEIARLTLVYEERRDRGMLCETALEAEHDARERAVRWIEQQAG